MSEISISLFDADAPSCYEGIVDGERRNSLAALFDLVAPGIDVLDVGIGSGALGRRLSSERNCLVDGVTVSTDEAENATGYYRRIAVADLNVVRLDSLFEGRRYGAIICADVLEHLLRPTSVLNACRRLLTDDGVLLLSIPNVAYVGLLGELLDGEFRYRVEGLLDRTHLRFFTRNSLLRMLREADWQVDHVEPVRLQLTDSEFRVSFDRLPPPVQRYLLAMPDALTYQFVVRARAQRSSASASVESEQARASELETTAAEAPHFSSLLYLKDSAGYSEARKLVAFGRIGDARQRIRFTIPAQQRPLLALRFDPADRPGFLHLFGIRLYSARAEPIWQWDGALESLARGAAQQVLFRTPWFAHSEAVLLLTGEDPNFELPLKETDLQACHEGAVLEIELGWPMSADYALFVDELKRREGRIESLGVEVSLALEGRRSLEQRLHQLEQQLVQLDPALEQIQVLAAERDRLTAEAVTLRSESASLQAEKERLCSELLAMTAERDELGSHVKTLRLMNADLGRDAQSLQVQVDAVKAVLDRQRAANELRGQELEQARRRLHEIESSRVFRLLSPLLGRHSAGAERYVGQPAIGLVGRHVELSEAVDVIVPVFKGLEEVRTCLGSVLASTPKTPFRLVIVNDASPDPEITLHLRQLRDSDSRIELLENPLNVGFVASVNRAMQLSDGHDVILLNSDTEVAGDWLDRLRQAAARDDRAATVTPFSNCAEICSYPRVCADNPLPENADVATIDRMFADANAGRAIEIPTAVGFCMFIRRRCLNEVGLFDTEHFGRGYGEENDFSMRARKAGWRNLLALDVFVRHAGGVSFGEEKARRVQQAQEVLARLHPDYHILVHEHLQKDPARTARMAVDVARLRGSGLPSVLLVLHNAQGGGTEKHVLELAAVFRGRANMLALRPAQGGETIVEWLSPNEGFKLGFRLPDDYENLVAALRSLGVAHVHFHHFLGHSPSVWGLPRSLGVTHDFTVHDYYSFCPQITLTDQSNKYCGERGPAQCANCLQRSPAPGRVSIAEWRAGYLPIMEHARFVFAPSADAAGRLKRYFPDANVVHVPHLDMDEPPPMPKPRSVGHDRPLRIVVLGALSPIKGADVLEAVASEAALRGQLLDFHLFGFAYRSLRKRPKANLTVHGQYDESELPELLAWLKPDVAWFPAQWPETYSYTLSACLKAGLPIVAPQIGAFPERLRNRPWTWLCPWDQPALAWVEFFEQLRADHFVEGKEPELAASGGEAAPGEFSYRRRYLEGVVMPVLAPPLPHEFLERHRPGNATPLVTERSKRALLALAVRLRKAPMLRGLARRIPLRWQTRVKVWLST